MLSEGHVFICVQHQFPNEPLRFFVSSCSALAFALSCYNSLTVDELGGISTSDASDWLCACLRKEDGVGGNWKNAAIIDKREKVQKKEWP